MDNIILKLKKDELKKMQQIIEGKQNLTDHFYGGVEKIEHNCVQENPFKNVNQDFFGQFMQWFAQDKMDKHVKGKDLDALAQDVKITPMKLIETMGSTGLNEIIEKYINELEKLPEITNEQVDSLIELASSRNEIETAEIQYLNASYKDYLETQIKLKAVETK